MQDSTATTKYQTTPASATTKAAAALPCYLVNNLAKNTEEQCKFIVDNDCLEDEATFDYVYFVFCELGYETRLLAVSLIVCLVLVLFLNLSAVADEFLCPSLLTVAKSLRMSDSLASPLANMTPIQGVTLLAFGNGCPDIFSSLAAASSGRPELIVGELLGAGVFCTSIVAGLIFINADFKLARRPLLRDASFYLLAVYLIWTFCNNQSITFYGSLAFIVIYVIYLFIALCGQAIHSRLRGEYPLHQVSPCTHSPAATFFVSTVEKSGHNTPSLCHQDASPNKDNENWFKWRDETSRRRSSVRLEQLQLANQLGLADRQKTTVNAYSRWSECELAPAVQSSSATVATIELPPSVGGLEPQQSYSRETLAKLANSSGGQKLDLQRMPIKVQIHGVQCQLERKPAPPSTATEEQQLKDNPKLEALEERNSRTSPDRHGFTHDEFDDFLFRVNPINTILWSESSLWVRAITVLRAPLLLVTILTVPVVDQERVHHNWCRLLNSIHCFMVPGAVVTLTKLGSSSWLYSSSAAQLDDELDNDRWAEQSALPLRLLLLLLPGLLLALFVFNTTSAERPPKYHSLFAFFGFLMSVLWIYVLANEIISLLKTVGIIFSMSDTAIGLGVLAWGNSLGDIVANLTLAQAGHARMALGASIGAPLLNLLLGFGLAFTVSLRPGESVALEYNATMGLLAGSLALVLLLLMGSTVLFTNHSKRPLGYCLVACYGVYFVLAVCLECKLF